MSATTHPVQISDYRSVVWFDTPPEAVFDALTTLRGLAGWWSPVTGSAAAGGELRFTHRDEESLAISVAAAERPRLVRWVVRDYALNPEWAGTEIVFELRPTPDGGTALDFLRRGLTPQLECYEHCSRGWDHFLPSLRAYAETGAGSPLS